MKVVTLPPKIKLGENTLKRLSDFIKDKESIQDEIAGGICLLQTKDKDGQTSTYYRVLGLTTAEEVIGLVELFKMNYIFTNSIDEPDNS